MISRLPGSRCLEVSGCSLRRKAGGRVAHDETRDVDRRRAATALDRARVRAQRSCSARPRAIAWRGARGALRVWRHARASGMALGMGARDDHARQRLGPGRRIPLRARAAGAGRGTACHQRRRLLYDFLLPHVTRYCTKCYHVWYQVQNVAYKKREKNAG